MPSRPKICVIGIGNLDRGDDAAGRLVARRLGDFAPPGVEIVECDGAAAELVELLGRADSAFLIDAGAFGATAGTVRRLDASRERIAAAAGPSTHGFGLAQAVELARALGRLPRCCMVYVVEGSGYDFGAPLSPAVADAIPVAARLILGDLPAAIGATPLARR